MRNADRVFNKVSFFIRFLTFLLSAAIIMSDNNEMLVGINWIEEAISKKLIKYYKYEDFTNVEYIGRGDFGKIYRASRKISEKCFVLKSLLNLDDNAVKEIVHEVIIIV